MNRINGTANDIVDSKSTDDEATETETNETFIATDAEDEINREDNNKGSDEALVSQESQDENGKAARVGD